MSPNASCGVAATDSAAALPLPARRLRLATAGFPEREIIA
jgi:hypothetical protein